MLNNLKKILITSVIWCLLVTGVCLFIYFSRDSVNEYTYLNNYTALEGTIYISENEGDHSIIYAMDSSGNVLHFFDTNSTGNGGTVEAIYASSDGSFGSIYTALRREAVVAGQVVYAWQVLTFDRELSTRYQSALVTPVKGSILADVRAVGEDTVLTFITEDGREVYSCVVPRDIMGKPDSASEKSMGNFMGTVDALSEKESSGDKAKEEEKNRVYQIQAVASAQAGQGRYAVDAYFDGQSIILRLDNEKSLSDFYPEQSVRDIFKNKHIPANMSLQMGVELIRYWALFLGVGILVIIAMYVLLSSKNRNIYVLVVVETLLFIMSAAFVTVVYIFNNESRSAASAEFASYSLRGLISELGNPDDYDYNAADFYDSEDYFRMQRRIATFVSGDGYKDTVYDLFVCNATTGQVAVSASGRNHQIAWDLYSSAVKDVIGGTLRGSQISRGDVRLAGKDYMVLAVRDRYTFTPGYVFVALMSRGARGDDIFSMRRMYALVGFGLFICSSLLIFFFMYLQSRDLKKITMGMQEVAVGDLVTSKDAMVMGRDMDTMWNALYEIDKRVKKINYTKYLIFESYYRFAPKCIEKILNKTSITEVVSGDENNLRGTMAYISTADSGNNGKVNSELLNSQLEVIAQCQNDGKGVLVGNDSSMSLIQMLFLEETRDVTDFGVYFMHSIDSSMGGQKPDSLMLLDYGEFDYGVAGTMEHSSTFIVSNRSEELCGYVEWLRELGLKLVISDSVKERERIPGRSRSIGYVLLKESGEKIWLHEILDAESEKIRMAKLATLDRFEEALQLFYENDFYLARNAFGEVLKALPEDGIARWYVFECERNLNGTPLCFTGALYMAG